MGQQVNRSSKVNSLSESDYIYSLSLKAIDKNVLGKLLLLDPKPGDLTKTRL